MAPQYFFYNLPSSESKDILQHIMDHDGPGGKDKQPTPQAITSATQTDCPEPQSYDRCVIQ